MSISLSQRKSLSHLYQQSNSEFLHQPAQSTRPSAPSIAIGIAPLARIECFKYLRSFLSYHGSFDGEIASRVGKTSQAISRLRTTVLNQHHIQQTTELRVRSAVELPFLLYSFDTWILYRRHIENLEQYYAISPFHSQNY
ncbi:hypothetical protein ElyMa_004979400 [Elysia marginata]|uniref:Uncharacterized protein n=1 Tax=Elysia marginata TaxID=1093978 RepID=A0AAV4J9S1_9GAST|nr:hypothetical protein ElyMa_004979400 [Elysia marginata]